MMLCKRFPNAAPTVEGGRRECRRSARGHLTTAALLFLLAILAACGAARVEHVEGREIVADHREIDVPEPRFPERPPSRPPVPEAVPGLDEYADWGPYNVHDPSGLRFDGWFYVYSTDVAVGYNPDTGGLGDRVGLQIRRSRDLVEWEFVGWVFEGIPRHTVDYVSETAGTAPTNMWAPGVVRVDDEFRIYYSVSRIGTQNSVIGLAVADHPEGPWEDRGPVLRTRAAQSPPVNAIDANVVIDHETGRHWMVYGSYWEGLRVLELDPDSGMPLEDGYGEPLVRRSSPGDSVEAPVVTYNEEFDAWYLFFSYGWLADTYRVLVGRADSPEGPYYDHLGRDLSEPNDGGLLVVAPHRFSEPRAANRSNGWQGTGHSGVIRDGSDHYLLHNARPSANYHWTQLHVRTLAWGEDGWPRANPMPYAGEGVQPVPTASIPGEWEIVVLHPDARGQQARSTVVTFTEDNLLVQREQHGSWAQTGENTASVVLGTGLGPFEGVLFASWDWENDRPALTFSGITESGTILWAKRLDSE